MEEPGGLILFCRMSGSGGCRSGRMDGRGGRVSLSNGLGVGMLVTGRDGEYTDCCWSLLAGFHGRIGWAEAFLVDGS
jgi:hypothetical protein